MSTEKAKAIYRNKGCNKLNCGQAVIAAFEENFPIGEDTIKLFAAYGSGRAPEGLCGAYYAAKYLLKDDDKIKKLEESFIADGGSIKCRELRKLRKLPCIGCVEKAANFIETTCGISSPGSASSCALAPENGISLERQIRIISGSMVVLGAALAIIVHWAFIAVPLFVGFGLIYAGATDNCLMGLLLMKLPYNKQR